MYFGGSSPGFLRSGNTLSPYENENVEEGGSSFVAAKKSQQQRCSNQGNTSADYDCWGGVLGCVICVLLFLFLLFALSYPMSYHYRGWTDRNRNGIPDHRESYYGYPYANYYY